MSPEIKLFTPKREKRKVLFVLPVEQIGFLDDAADAIGIDRSAFLTVYIDTFAENMQSFVAGWATGMKFYQERVSKDKVVSQNERLKEEKDRLVITRGRPPQKLHYGV